MLAALVAAQWGTTAALGLTATHNGWLFYHGGDGTYYWTSTWSLAHHHVPEAVISYGLPLALWPLGLVFGANMLAALPAVVAFQVLLLAPLGVLATYGLAARLGGRLYGYTAAAAWILAPVLALWYFDPVRGTGYRSQVHDLVIPNAVGLTTLADYTSMILALVSTYLVVRALDDRRFDDVVLAGLSTGALIAVKPSNGYYLLAPLVAFAACRRWRDGLAFFALLVPALVTIAAWKKIGLGYLPAVSAPAATAAPAAGIVPSPSSLDTYFPFDWHTFTHNLDGLRYFGNAFWVVEWLTIGGIVGLVRRTPAYGLAIAAWFASYLLFKGGAAGRATADSTSFLRLVMPAFPAFVLIAVSVVFLLPGVPRRHAFPASPVAPTRAALVAALLLAAYPLAFVATAKAWPPGHVAKNGQANLLVPVSSELRATSVVRDGEVRLSWRAPAHGSSRVQYQVLRSPGADCDERTTGSRDCLLLLTKVWFTERTAFVDPRPPRAGATYRVGLLAGWTGEIENADLVLVGPPLRVDRPAP